ncbi:sulfatase-like hydrolase/transferase [Candidatus Poribacteria bacterium]|nr:sulfatase-like hydrolase/transferase [Candidatus Poribacteria bacterium]
MGSPNILLLMTDQQRWDAMGCSGDWVQTPNLDRIASEGVQFTNCVTTSPVCIPTRLSLATGLYPHNTGVWNNMNHTMPSETPTWMQAMRGAGYRTSLFGKTHLHPHGGDLREREGLMNAYGLDDVNEIGGPRASAKVLSHMTAEWEEKGLWDAYQADYRERFSTKPYLVRPSPLGLENYADVYVGQQAKQYLQNYDRQEPWCCWVSFGGPHEPWDTPEPYASMYDPEEMPSAVPCPPAGERPRGHLDQVMQRMNPAFEPGEIGRLRANYAGNVTLIDAQIGEILDTIAARGELEHTIIVHTSDHGEMNGDYGLIYKSNFLNGAVRIPLLVRTPDNANAGSTCDSPTEWIDIGPTLVEMAGGELEHRQFGKSLCPVLTDPETTHRDFAISEIQGEIMLLNQQWKAALNKDGEVYLLFDVQNDPNETNNLAGKPEVSDVETALRLQILERLMQTQLGKPFRQ